MEHRIILGGEAYLPFARSRIKALRATGLKYASQRFIMPGGETVRVQIVGDQEFIELNGGIQMYVPRINAGNVEIYTKKTDARGNWKLHSQTVSSASYSWISKLGRNRFNLGANESPVKLWWIGRPPLIVGPSPTPGYSGAFDVHNLWTGSGDNAGGMYLIEDVYTTVYSDFSVTWACYQSDVGTSAKIAKPAMYEFPYVPELNGNLGLKMSVSTPVHMGDGKYVYVAGGADNTGGAYTTGAGRMLSVVVTQDFNTYTAYDVTSQLGVLAAYSFMFSSGGAYLGDQNVMFGSGSLLFWKYPGDVSIMILFNTSTGLMTLRTAPVSASTGWNSTADAPWSLGKDSLCHWQWLGAVGSITDWRIVVSTDLGQTWTFNNPVFYDATGAVVAVSKIMPYLNMRRPVKKTGTTIDSNGEMVAGFSVLGRGCVEFRSRDLCATWHENGLIHNAENAARVVISAADLDPRFDSY